MQCSQNLKKRIQLVKKCSKNPRMYRNSKTWFRWARAFNNQIVIKETKPFRSFIFFFKNDVSCLVFTFILTTVNLWFLLTLLNRCILHRNTHCRVSICFHCIHFSKESQSMPIKWYIRVVQEMLSDDTVVRMIRKMSSTVVDRTQTLFYILPSEWVVIGIVIEMHE